METASSGFGYELGEWVLSLFDLVTDAVFFSFFIYFFLNGLIQTPDCYTIL